MQVSFAVVMGKVHDLTHKLTHKLKFLATLFDFKPTLLLEGAAPGTQIFSIGASQQASGVLFGTNFRMTNRRGNLTSFLHQETYTAVLLGNDHDPESKYELRRKFGIYYETPGEKYRGSTVHLLSIQRKGRFFERVGAGKMVKSALSGIRCTTRVIKLI
ncbi:hypothetical protein Vi05172_g1967 [Venturia inaequalis]|nr:hypothetical protein Vi05172_g1967 [Venturia inaequalis]